MIGLEMKIFLENIDANSSSGPNSFAKKLLPHLKSLGHSFTTPEIADVALCFIESPNPTLPCPRVLRLDGIYFNEAQNYEMQNRNIKRTYDDSEGVIFQSDFCKELIVSHFGEPSNSSVIHNGADVKMIDKIVPMSKEKYDNIWCCASSWRPHKRLSENIRYFMEHKGENDILIVAGEVPTNEQVRESSVVYFGNLNQNQLYSLYKASKYFIHLAWLDHCPNVVVDARACGCHIVCSSAGGTREIAGLNSTILEEEKWDFKPVFLYEPPTMNFANKTKNDIESVYDMCEVSKKYNNFMEKIYASSS
jgi:glycosyltransferase involved in cell wall biosynthesis